MGKPQSPDSKRQIFWSEPLCLADVQSQPEAAAALPSFLVMTPDSRLRTKLTVLFSPSPPWSYPFDLTAMGNTLYLEEVEQDYGGPSAELLPCTAIEGTFSAPTAITQDNLLGYSREFVTAADAIRGWLTMGIGIGFNGQIVLQARWQAEGQRIPADEWDEITRLCSCVGSQVKF